MFRPSLDFPYLVIMQLAGTTKLVNNRLLDISIKVGLFILLFGSIYIQLFTDQDVGQLSRSFKSVLSESFVLYLTAAALLMLVNWGLEARKWQLLMRPVQRLGYLGSFSAIFMGTTVSLFTPNRIGEYGGRVLRVEAGKRINAVAATIVGSISQLIVNLSAGLLLGAYFLYSRLQLDGLYLTLMSLAVTVAIALLTAIYFNLGDINKLMSRWGFFKKAVDKLVFLNEYSTRQLLHYMLLSLARYGVYITQYVLFLYVFGIDIGIWEAVMAVNVLFFLQSIIPSVAITELGIRGNLALVLLGTFGAGSVAILSASWGLWLLNVLIPAVIGYLMVLNIRFTKN